MADYRMSETFIREYRDHAPQSFCQELCDYANDIVTGKLTGVNSVMGGYDTQHNRSDFAFWLTEGSRPDLKFVLHQQWAKLCGGEGGYLDEFSQLSANDFYMDATKIQVTYPGEGFHQWHYDNSGFLVQGREFVIITYLNDGFEGGETEFLHQGVRIKPEAGKTVIFPASYTHMHRGNPPLNGVKIIATTWASRIPRMDTETCATDIPGYIVPSEAQITYYKNNKG